MIIPLLALLQQAAAPTVGDTIWLERAIETPPGAEVRAVPWTPEGQLGLLGHPVVRRDGRRTIVAYPAVAWAAGRHTLRVPGPVVIRSDGTTDSLPSEARTIIVASVLPDSLPPERLPVQPEAGIVAQRVTSPWPLLVLLLGAAVIYLPLLWWWRRPGPPMPALRSSPVAVTLPLAEWSEAGEPRAVAAAANRALRGAISSQLPAVSQGLVASRLIRLVGDQRPGWPVEELGIVLRALEAAQYAETPGAEVVALAARAGDLRRRLEHSNGQGAPSS